MNATKKKVCEGGVGRYGSIRMKDSIKAEQPGSRREPKLDLVQKENSYETYLKDS